MPAAEHVVDRITAEIVRSYLDTTVEEILSTLIRSTQNPLFSEAHDCSGGVFYYDGEVTSLVAIADSNPVHTFASLSSVEACLDFFHGDLSSGDVLIVSDPYFGGTHIADYTIVKPVFFQGRPLFFPSVRGHVVDSGGAVPAGFSLENREIWHEGFRFSPMKLTEKGERRREVWDLLRSNNRLPDLIESDLDSMIGACTVGEQRIRSLCDKYGVDEVLASVDWILDYSERRFREQIRKWPNGTYRATSRLDSDWVNRHDLAVEVALTVDDDEIRADFTGTEGQSEGIINSVEANTLSYLCGAFTVLCEDIPINSGFFRPLSATLPERSLVNPEAPAPAAYATLAIGADIGEAIMKACEQFAPDRVSTFSIDTVLCWLQGVDERNGRFFLCFDNYCTAVCSGGARGADGWGAWTSPFASLKLPSIEMSERLYPIMYHDCDLVVDTAAPGEFRGSPGMLCRREPYKSMGPQTMIMLINGLVHPPHGYVGGASGSGTYAWITDGEERQLITESHFSTEIVPGKPLSCLKGAAGGWGDPLDREPRRVHDDVLDGLVSVAGALEDYGVVIDPETLMVEAHATERERALRCSEDPPSRRTPLGRRTVIVGARIEDRVADTEATAESRRRITPEPEE